MKITCQSCQSKYNVADEKVQGKIVKIRCRKCGATIVVQGTGGSATNGSAGASGGATSAGGAATTEADSAQWHVNVADGEPKTMPLSELVEAYSAGTITLETYIWTDGMDDWKPISEVEMVMAALPAAGAPAPELPSAFQAPAEPAFQSSLDEGLRAAAYEPAPPIMAAAFNAPAQVPADRPSEPRRAAVTKREARGRDLFGSRVAEEEVQTSAPAVPRMMAGPVDDSASKATGERNENSVLFSLAVLTKDADDRSSQEDAPKAGGRTTEDSGLIDLKALAAKAESRRPPAFADMGAFASPLGFAAPATGSVLGGPLGDAPPKSKLPLLIGGGAGVALLLVLGIVIGVKLGGASGAAAAASATPAATATVEPTPTVTATATAEPSATAAPTASAVAVKPKSYGGGGTYHPPAGGGAKPAGGAATAATGGGATPPPPPPPKKATSDCGCNGDLMCLMKCSTH